LIEGVRAEVRDPTWSHNGREVLVSYGPTIAGKLDSNALYVINVSSPALDHRIPGSDGLFSPRWSLDGRYIAALSGDASKLLLYDRQKGWQTVIKEAKLGYPNWSSDSHSLYILDETGPSNVIKRIHIPDLKIDTVLDLSGYQQPCTIFGGWVGI